MIDAHSHLADPLLFPQAADLIAASRALGIQKSVVNGTSPDDWPAVLQLAAAHPDFVIPSLGLHPWEVNDAPDHWLDELTGLIVDHPAVHLGECGLDRWIEGHDIHRQIDALLPQIALAHDHDRSLTLHCIQAWGHLVDTLRSTDLPRRGFLVHAYNGSLETAHQLLDLGAFFSYSTYFLHERKRPAREVFAKLPLERILIETDAPHLSPPPEAIPHKYRLPEQANHPANLSLALESLHHLHPVAELQNIANNNAQKLFH